MRRTAIDSGLVIAVLIWVTLLLVYFALRAWRTEATIRYDVKGPGSGPRFPGLGPLDEAELDGYFEGIVPRVGKVRRGDCGYCGEPRYGSHAFYQIGRDGTVLEQIPVCDACFEARRLRGYHVL